MRRASDILLKISHILGIVCGIILLICFVPAMCTAFIPEVREAIVENFQNNGVDFGDDPEVLATFAQIMIICYSLTFVFIGVMAIVDAVVAKKTMENPTKGGYIACIILGAFSTNTSIVGGILGLIALNKERHRPLEY